MVDVELYGTSPVPYTLDITSKQGNFPQQRFYTHAHTFTHIYIYINFKGLTNVTKIGKFIS
jgi:hypothetical protein